MDDPIKSYFIYILECSNGAYYTGYTTDIVRRYEEHSRGTTKCKYTRSFPPVRIAACWEIQSPLSKVLKIEAAIKKLPKNKKHKLMANPSHLMALTSKDDCSAIITVVEPGLQQFP